MLDPTAQSNAAQSDAAQSDAAQSHVGSHPPVDTPSADQSTGKSTDKLSYSEPSPEQTSSQRAQEPLRNEQRPLKKRWLRRTQPPWQGLFARQRSSSRRRRNQHPVFKRLDSQYWKRLLRYLYVRFLRIQSSPEAIARGAAAGIFAGAFPLIGLQSVFGIAIAALIRGNKMIAVAGTFVSNPFTSIPIFAFNFYLGRWILGVPEKAALPASMTDINAWLSMGMDVFIAMLLGSLIVGGLGGLLGYYLGLVVAQRVETLKKAKQRRKEAQRNNQQSLD
jgi:uncharacterized protein